MDASVMTAFDVLAEQMRSAGYMESTIANHRRQFQMLGNLCEGGVYSYESGEEFARATHSDNKPFSTGYANVRRRIITLMNGYAQTGAFDLTPKKRPEKQRPENSLGEDLAQFEEELDETELTHMTKKNYVDYARLLLLFLESSGIDDVQNIIDADIWSFMAHICEQRPNTSAASIASHVNPYLKYLGRDDLLLALKMTIIPKPRTIIDVLSDEDENAIAEACCNRLVSARDAAITLLALTTGLRSCDVINLRMGNICWDSMSIGIIQSKTGNPLSLPLPPAVAEALAEYILEDRPQPYVSNDDHVFLRTKAPHTPLCESASVYQATERDMQTVGLKGGGSRLLRHNAATKLLQAGAKHSVISAVLGHASAGSTTRYIELSSDSMRVCVLPLPKGAKS